MHLADAIVQKDLPDRDVSIPAARLVRIMGRQMRAVIAHAIAVLPACRATNVRVDSKIIQTVDSVTQR